MNTPIIEEENGKWHAFRYDRNGLCNMALGPYFSRDAIELAVRQQLSRENIRAQLPHKV